MATTAAYHQRHMKNSIMRSCQLCRKLGACHFAQIPPWNYCFHLGEKLVSAHGFARTFETFICKGLLAHSVVLQDV
jgi:hypothetical protein